MNELILYLIIIVLIALAVAFLMKRQRNSLYVLSKKIGSKVDAGGQNGIITLSVKGKDYILLTNEENVIKAGYFRDHKQYPISPEALITMQKYGMSVRDVSSLVIKKIPVIGEITISKVVYIQKKKHKVTYSLQDATRTSFTYIEDETWERAISKGIEID